MVLAREDLKAAGLIKVAAPQQAAFFLQQAVEKIGEVLLIGEGIGRQRLHAIGELAALQGRPGAGAGRWRALGLGPHDGANAAA